jgi:hypothetical protein
MGGGLKMPSAPWRIALASAIGTSHLGSETPCQDSAAYDILDTDDGPLLVAAVCDGAGSARHSEIGSRLAADTFTELVRTFIAHGGRLQRIDREIASDWVRETALALVTAADIADHEVRDYACTLLVAIIGKDAAVFIQIGDGAVVISNADEDDWSWVFWPQHGEFANTTNFVTSSNATEVMEFSNTAGRVDELAVFSDGIENLVLHHATRTVHAAFFDGIFPPVRKAGAGLNRELSRSLESYLSSPRVCDRTDDDKTLVLATRRTTSA